MIYSILFILLWVAAIALFTWNVKKISRNIKLGKDIDIKDNRKKRWGLVLKVAVGQSKMFGLPISGILHVFVYAGFILVNIEKIANALNVSIAELLSNGEKEATEL